MTRIVSVVSLILLTTDIYAAECDCSSYPFVPNPPCYGVCADKLSAHKDIDLSLVKNLDPGVAVSIKVLSLSKERGETDFKNIKKKLDLEREALKALSSPSR